MRIARKRLGRVLIWNAALLAGVFGVFLSSRPASSYLAQIEPGATTPGIHWDSSFFPIVWNFNPQTLNSNITGDRDKLVVIQASFQTWTSAPNLSLQVSQGGDTGTALPGCDGQNVISFSCPASNAACDFSKDSSTLAVTITTTSNVAGQRDCRGNPTKFVGQILDADTLFNPNVSFTTNTAGPPSDNPGPGQPGRVDDLQTVATHEIGHFFGMDHSGVVRAVMFPFAPDFERTLGYDDVAGMATLYPKTPADVATGAIIGAVKASDGSPIFGAHVFANSTTTADLFNNPNIRKTPIGTMSLPDGTYKITGLPQDSYTVIAEPLDQPVTNADISGFGPAFKGNGGTIQTNFVTRWH
jgi:Matrixin